MQEQQTRLFNLHQGAGKNLEDQENNEHSDAGARDDNLNH
jgi:hypothetical protein